MDGSSLNSERNILIQITQATQLTTLFVRISCIPANCCLSFRVPLLTIRHIYLDLLLMAFYLDKAFLPSPCWMVTGAMARVCQDIGLYRRTPAGMFSGIDVESRTRLFWAAYIQDRKISMKQGRPVIFLDKHIDVGLPGEHMGAGVGSGKGENLEAAKKSLQVFRATIRVAQTSESLLNINLKHDGETEDVQLLQSVDEMLKRSWEAYPPDLTDLSESGPIYLPALRRKW